MNDLDKMLNSLGDYAHKMLLKDKIKELMPMYHIIGDEDFIIGCPWKNEREKLMILEGIKQKAKEVNATMIGFVSEVWLTQHDKNADLTKVVQPSKSPDRIEGLFAMATNSIETKVKSWRIIRTGGVIIALDPMESAGMFSGRMIDGLLPSSRKPH